MKKTICDFCGKEFDLWDTHKAKLSKHPMTDDDKRNS